MHYKVYEILLIIAYKNLKSHRKCFYCKSVLKTAGQNAENG
ncbi:hypothetical protein HMPREF9436_03315 [Faecalibacterium cf. prausnitzii KLE1255]|uniref:Uncharacterized protein n=1 Tax=Faecalibacterium cf. prausnitzii KLE1255 TaxID=748224 RepID=E2ZNF7_9FIRM|nr:hypothetical protein HMPREF9436_03315 [Faecalibacterium cf. prausnitzii KLE1255]